MLNSPAIDPEVQEAESLRYGNRVFVVLPLSSGRFALLNRAFEVQAITDEGGVIEGGLSIIRDYVPPAPPPRREVAVNLSLEDLGL